MNNRSQTPSASYPDGWKLLNWFVGIFFIELGILNTFWGSDADFGVSILILSLVYFSPVTDFIKRKTGLQIPPFVKFLLGVFIIQTSLGVGEMFCKIELLVRSLN